MDLKAAIEKGVSCFLVYPFKGLYFLLFSIKKGITGWEVQILLWNLSWVAAFATTKVLFVLGSPACNCVCM